jgi:hypothetical protein
MEAKDIIDFILRLLGLVVSWQIILLSIVFLFREQISNILPILANRIKKIGAGGSELEFETPQIADTPLGKTDVSKILVKFSNEIVVSQGIQCSYVDSIYNFKISWPSNYWYSIIDAKEIQKIAEIAKDFYKKNNSPLAAIPINFMQASIFLMRKEIQNEIYSSVNINVTVNHIGHMQIDQFIDLALRGYREMGFEPQISVDNKTKGGFFSVIQKIESIELFHFQKFIIDSGKLYNLTATLPNIPNDPYFSEIRNEMLTIMNSFRIITYD